MNLPSGPYDIGPEHEGTDPHENYTTYDWIQESGELVHAALNAASGADRMNAIHRAHDLLTTAKCSAEDDILKYWMALGRHEIDPAEAAITENARKDLARDMSAIGWIFRDYKWRRPFPASPMALAYCQVLHALLTIRDTDDHSIFWPHDGRGGCVAPPPEGGCTICAVIKQARELVSLMRVSG